MFFNVVFGLPWYCVQCTLQYLYNTPCSIIVPGFNKTQTAKFQPTSLLRIRIETFQHSCVGYTILHHQTQQTIRMSAHTSVLENRPIRDPINYQTTTNSFDSFGLVMKYDQPKLHAQFTGEIPQNYHGFASSLTHQKIKIKNGSHLYTVIIPELTSIDSTEIFQYHPLWRFMKTSKTWFPTWPLSLRSPPSASPHSQPGVGFASGNTSREEGFLS